MSCKPDYILMLEPVRAIFGEVVAWELLTRFADDADINNKCMLGMQGSSVGFLLTKNGSYSSTKSKKLFSFTMRDFSRS